MARQSNHRNLFQRVVSASVLIPVAVASLVIGDWYFWLFSLFFSILATLEYYGIVARLAPAPFHFIGGVLPIMVFFLAGLAPDWPVVWVYLGIASAVMAGLGTLLRAGSIWFLLIGPFYTILPLLCGVALRDSPKGMMVILYILAVVWGSDIGGYLFGRLIGGPRLAPAISPGKTWAGAIGGILSATVLAGLVIFLAPVSQPLMLVLFAPVLSCVSQVGDLLESLLKRHYGVKDSGRLIPGHGGALDRIDGLLVAALFYSFFYLATHLIQDWW